MKKNLRLPFPFILPCIVNIFKAQIPQAGDLAFNDINVSAGSLSPDRFFLTVPLGHQPLVQQVQRA